VVVIVVMVVMLAGGERGVRHRGRLQFNFAGRAQCQGFALRRFFEGYSAGRAIAVLRAILGAAYLTRAAFAGSLGRSLRGDGLFRIHFKGQPLNGLQSGGDSLLSRFGMAHVVAEARKELVDRRILRQLAFWPAGILVRFP
jgi:hypothetical protein